MPQSFGFTREWRAHPTMYSKYIHVNKILIKSGFVSPICSSPTKLAFFAQLLSHVRFFVTSWTVAHQASLSTEFPRQEYWSGFSFPTLGDFPDPGIEPVSPVSSALAGEFFTTVAHGKKLSTLFKH